MFTQAAFYGIVVCGVRNIRVWLGPLPTAVCQTHSLFTKMTLTFCVLVVVMITWTRFMFICVWKGMRELNDDLIVKIAFNCSVFLSIWMSLTDFTLEGGKNGQLCSGEFSNSVMTMDWHEITKPKSRDLPR